MAPDIQTSSPQRSLAPETYPEGASSEFAVAFSVGIHLAMASSFALNEDVTYSRSWVHVPEPHSVLHSC